MVKSRTENQKIFDYSDKKQSNNEYVIGGEEDDIVNTVAMTAVQAQQA